MPKLQYQCSHCGKHFVTGMSVGIPQGMYYSGCRVLDGAFFCEECTKTWKDRNKDYKSFDEEHGHENSKRMFVSWWNKEVEKQAPKGSVIKTAHQSPVTGDFVLDD